MSGVFRFELGDEVRDQVTGFKGAIVAKTQWLNGCIRYLVQSEALNDGVPTEPQPFDEPQLKLVKAGKIRPDWLMAETYPPGLAAHDGNIHRAPPGGRAAPGGPKKDERRLPSVARAAKLRR